MGSNESKESEAGKSNNNDTDNKNASGSQPNEPGLPDGQPGKTTPIKGKPDGEPEPCGEKQPASKTSRSDTQSAELTAAPLSSKRRSQPLHRTSKKPALKIRKTRTKDRACVSKKIVRKTPKIAPRFHSGTCFCCGAKIKLRRYRKKSRRSGSSANSSQMSEEDLLHFVEELKRIIPDISEEEAQASARAAWAEFSEENKAEFRESYD